MTAPVFACVTPHPPIIVPEVGRGQEQEVQATLDAFAELRETLRRAAPDCLILISPHGPVSETTFHVLNGRLRGGLTRFGAGQVQFDMEGDHELTTLLLAEAEQRGVALTAIDEWEPNDHAAWVPLYHLQQAVPGVPIVALSISFASPHEHYALGRAVAAAIEQSGKRVAIIASADGAHALKDDGPYGFHPAAPRFEEEFQSAFREWDVDGVLAFDDEYRRLAAEDSVPSVSILMGALSGYEVRPRILAAEGPWGVGYMTAVVEVGAPRAEAERGAAKSKAGERGEPEILGLARRAVEAYIRDGRRVGETSLSDPMWKRQRAATFVSIHERSGALRGCIGTVEPTQLSAADEVVSNAIAAATQDPRFPPVTAAELASLVYKVDVLTSPEPIADASQLDARRYGVIVEAGSRRGLLLPDLEGIDTVEEQVAIARQKAGINPTESVALFRFQVQRYEA